MTEIVSCINLQQERKHTLSLKELYSDVFEGSCAKIIDYFKTCWLVKLGSFAGTDAEDLQPYVNVLFISIHFTHTHTHNEDTGCWIKLDFIYVHQIIYNLAGMLKYTQGGWYLVHWPFHGSSAGLFTVFLPTMRLRKAGFFYSHGHNLSGHATRRLA